MSFLILIVKIILLLGLTYLAGYLYHKGGDHDRWLWRITLIPFIQLFTMAMLFPTHIFIVKFWVAGAISTGLFAGSLSTYWKKKGTDALWYHWLATGFGFSLAIIPYMFVVGHWLDFLIRIVVLSLSVMIWSVAISRVSPEEGGRGGMAIASLGLFLLPF